MNKNTLKRTIILGSDHAGFKLKKIIFEYLQNSDNKELYDLIDVGTDSEKSVDFPDFAEKLCIEVLKNNTNVGILVCGSGIGVSITANKFPGIRCGLVHDHLTAKLSRQHTNCNVIAFGEGIIGPSVAKNIVDTFLSSELIDEEKYKRRIDKITEIEKKLDSKLNI